MVKYILEISYVK